MKNDIQNTLSYIKDRFPKDAVEVSDALGLLNLALDGILDRANESIAQAHKERNYESAMKLLEFSESISWMQSQINSLTEVIGSDESCEEDDEVSEENQYKQLPNYAEYAVDSAIPHTLYEDFKHKKANGFTFQGKKYEAKDWKDVLLKTCDLLAEIDADKFYSFIDDPTMRGSKVRYFGTSYVSLKNEKMKNLDVYVWVNLSANGKRNVIRKLLKKFGIKFSEYSIFLRADYTPLHPDSIYAGTIVETNTDKIGKHVRNFMREISNKSHAFSINELLVMQSKEWSKEILDLDYPLLRKFDEGSSIDSQIKDAAGYGRYWKEVFEFNAIKFLVTSQWFERQREAFDLWKQNILIS